MCVRERERERARARERGLLSLSRSLSLSLFLIDITYNVNGQAGRQRGVSHIIHTIYNMHVQASRERGLSGATGEAQTPRISSGVSFGCRVWGLGSSHTLRTSKGMG